jgi:alkanesulfonate monooxygenase SsuD/methylene tetrahydromethanopterin reductase-like flavin-dependent oxidoreductase (luciferase family)
MQRAPCSATAKISSRRRRWRALTPFSAPRRSRRTNAQAERIAASAELHYVRRAKGEYRPLESPEAAAAYPYTPNDRERLARLRGRLAVGSADRVKDRLLALADATHADEVMVTTMVFDHAARRHSYELLAQAFALRR